MTGIMLGEERHLTAQCLYFRNLCLGTQSGGHCHGQGMGGWGSEERWAMEPGDPRQGWGSNSGTSVRVENPSWMKERGEFGMGQFQAPNTRGSSRACPG